MEDYSVLEWRVNDSERAVRVLTGHGFKVRHAARVAEVGIDTAVRMQAAMHVLTENGVDCEMADIADGLYQG